MALYYTIGHSTRSLCELVAILERYEIRALIDVRAIPRSRTNPQFNRDTLPATLGPRGIDYLHFPELGGRRGRQREAGSSPNSYWQNQSFRNFADYAMSEGFREGFARLKHLGEEKQCVIMCSEALWWRCHRRIIADYLMLAGEAVVHIYGSDKVEQARPTPSARPTPDGKIVYDLAI
jgi:uncharacterized protein (DUF488 family)